LAELQAADPNVVIIREWLEGGVELIRDLVLPFNPEVNA